MTDQTDEIVVEETETMEGAQSAARSALREARALIPVGSGGVQITNLGQQIDYAQTMSKGKAALPAHLRGSIGDCLAIVDIASRAGLSPYMVANKTYVGPDGRLGFESQLYHAFAQSSGLLKGDLDVDYEGDGGETVCVITGVLKSDPTKKRVHRSPKLKDLHPGYTLSRRDGNETSKKSLTYDQGEKARAAGLADNEKLYSAGSPLWNRKPLVQLFYDTSRDWVRIFAPRAVLGIYTIDELEEYGPEFARDVTPRTSGVADRLKASGVDRSEGHQPGRAQQEVRDAKSGGAALPEDRKVDPATPIEDIEVFSAAAKRIIANAEVETLSGLLQLTEADLGKMTGCGPATLKNIMAGVEKCGWLLRDDSPPAPVEGSPANPRQKSVGGEPKNVAEWTPYCRGWLARAKAEKWPYADVRAQWDKERSLRNGCGVTSEERDPVQREMVALCKELGEPEAA